MPEAFTSLCQDLATTPRTDLGLILVTGATGYIGGRLVPELLARHYRVRVMVRTYASDYENRWSGAEVVQGDALEPETLNTALRGVDTAYYLIHSLLLGQKKFEETDILAAVNFRTAAEACGLRRIIYLGGLGDATTQLSAHLKNRRLVGDKLSQGKVPVTRLRAGMIIGSGSASYEILANLVRNTPVFLIPRWAKARSQPIALRDVIKYLVGVLEKDETIGKVYDIGGKTILSYEEKLKRFAKIMGKKRLFIPGFIQSPAFYGYLSSMLTPVPAPVTKVLVMGCKNEVICTNHDIMELISFEPMTFDEAIMKALAMEKKDKVLSRWSDTPYSDKKPLRLNEVASPVYTRQYSLFSKKDAATLYSAVCRIGGKYGWVRGNIMWRLSYVLDRFILGVARSRGRRSYSELRVDDVVDYFRVEDIKKNSFLLLRAEKILPGKAWMAFHIDPANGQNKLTVKAYLLPEGFWAKVFWNIFLPFHFYIFKVLIRKIEKKAF